MSLQLGEEVVAEDGIRVRQFAFEEGGERVPGLLWLPSFDAGGKVPETGDVPLARPLVLAGHGFGLDKRYPFPEPSVRSLVSRGGCAVAILDAPCHGERRASSSQSFEVTARDYRTHWGTYAGSRIAVEYASAARLLATLPEIGRGPLGYWGLSLGTQYGLAYLARSPGRDSGRKRETDGEGELGEHREVRAAVIGLFGRGKVVAHYAARVRCPVFFIQQLDDEIHPPEGVAALFAEIAGPGKELAASSGAHVEVPQHVRDAAVDFLLRHLRAPQRA